MMPSPSDTALLSYPQLPPEIHFRIVELMTDSRYLARAWLNFRLVSRNFKAITESVFARQHLPKAIIDFPTITNTVYGGACNNKYGLGLTLSFVKLDGENNERAVFSERPPELVELKSNGLNDGDLEEYENTLYHCITVEWQNCFFDFSMPVLHTTDSSFACPLSVRRVVSDAAPPGLKVEWEDHSISVLWKEFLTVLFAEEDYLQRRRIDHSRIEDTQEKPVIKAGGLQAWLLNTLISGLKGV